MTLSLTYHNSRFGDRFEIDLNEDGSFQSALRYVDRADRDPIHYTQLRDIPSPMLQEIEQLLWENLNGK